MIDTQVKKLMTVHPVLINPNTSLEDAAAKMAEIDCGVLPIGTENIVEGIITDRDIVIRAISKGKNPAIEQVCDYMTDKVFACNEDDTLEKAADIMHEHDVSRLIVKNKAGKVTGILSFGCIIHKASNAAEVANAVEHATRARVA